jgi:hypothetical protein
MRPADGINSLPLDRPRRLAGHVLDDAVDTLDLGAQVGAAGQFVRRVVIANSPRVEATRACPGHVSVALTRREPCAMHGLRRRTKETDK